MSDSSPRFRRESSRHFQIKIRVDANQAYRSKEAIRVIKTLKKYNLELVEQPVAWWDVVGLSEVRKAVDTPIMPHESLYNIIDAKRLVEMRAVDLFGLKLDRPGGITNAKIAYHLAELHNIPCTVISSIELGISTSASIQFAATFKSLEFACEASGSVIISDDVVKQQVKIQNGFAEIPTGQGLGVELDEQKLSKYCEEVISCK